MKRTYTASLAAAAAVVALASAAAANGRDAPPAVAPLAEHVQSGARGYQVTVHPAFSSSVTLLGQDGGGTELYRQPGTHNLPAGQTAAPAQHVVKLQGGPFDRDIGFVVNDPKHQIARITVELYGPDHKPGMQGSPVVERVVVENNAKTCPPLCDTGSGSR